MLSCITGIYTEKDSPEYKLSRLAEFYIQGTAQQGEQITDINIYLEKIYVAIQQSVNHEDIEQLQKQIEREVVSMNRELEMAKLACRALDEKKGKDIKVIDIHEVSVIAVIL